MDRADNANPLANCVDLALQARVVQSSASARGVFWIGPAKAHSSAAAAACWLAIPISPRADDIRGVCKPPAGLNRGQCFFARHGGFPREVTL